MQLPLAQLVINGLALGSLYALVALGIVLIYKTTRVITFGQGEMAMFSAFIAYTLFTQASLPFGLVLVLTILFAGIFGVLVERLLIRPVANTSPANPVMITVGLSLVLYGLAGWLWGYDIKTFPPLVSGPPLRTGGMVISPLSILILGITLVLMLLLFAFLRYTVLGVAMRAVAQNRSAARLMGIRVDHMNALGWGIGTALGAVAGILLVPLTYLDPGMMGDVALKAFAGAVLGGITSLPGAVIGGLLLGIIDSIVGYQAAQLRTTIAFGLIVLVLVLRPGGLSGMRG